MGNALIRELVHEVSIREGGGGTNHPACELLGSWKLTFNLDLLVGRKQEKGVLLFFRGRIDDKLTSAGPFCETFSNGAVEGNQGVNKGVSGRQGEVLEGGGVVLVVEGDDDGAPVGRVDEEI